MPATEIAVPEDMQKRIEQYIGLRDKLKVIDEEHENRRKDYVQMMERVSGLIRSFMEANKLENLKTKAGTCYTSTRHTASLADPDAFMKFVIATNRFDLMDRRANATAIKEYVEAEKVLPPGVNLTALQTVGVRRPTGK